MGPPTWSNLDSRGGDTGDVRALLVGPKGDSSGEKCDGSGAKYTGPRESLRSMAPKLVRLPWLVKLP